MNKAFVRESDAPPPRCPGRDGCGQQGIPVLPDTLSALLPAASAALLASEAFYCPNPACRVAYFDAWGGLIKRDALGVRAWPKEPQGLVCACLGVSVAELVAEARAGKREAVLRIIAAARCADARCSVTMPDGRSCEREVRRLFQHREIGEPK